MVAATTPRSLRPRTPAAIHGEGRVAGRRHGRGRDLRRASWSQATTLSVASATTMQTAITRSSPTRMTPRCRGEAGLAHGPRRLPPDRGVPLLRRPDRQPEGRARGPDQRVADGRGLRRLRRRATPNAGIINNTAKYPTITTAVLTETNEKGGETNISTGWHAIEFLLWGQDNNPTGPGKRPVDRLHHGHERRASGRLPPIDHRPARRRPHQRAGPVGRRQRRVPEEVPGEPQAGDRQRVARDRCAERGRARGRAHGGRRTRPRTRKTSTAASATTRTPTSSVTSSGIRRVYLGRLPGCRAARASATSWPKVNPQLDTKLQRPARREPAARRARSRRRSSR